MLKSDSHRYGLVAVTLHWVSALVIFGMITSGIRMEDMTDDAVKTDILTAHAIFGFLVLALTVARIAWWLFADRRPDPLPGTPKWQDRAAAMVHGVLYVVIVAMVGSGIALMAVSGAGAILFGGVPGPLPDFGQFLPRAAHGVGASVLMALLAGHVGAALYHHFIRRDGLLYRMGLRRAA